MVHGRAAGRAARHGDQCSSTRYDGFAFAAQSDAQDCDAHGNGAWMGERLQIIPRMLIERNRWFVGMSGDQLAHSFAQFSLAFILQ